VPSARARSRHELVSGQRPAEQVTLPEVAAGRAQALEVRRRLDSLGDDLQSRR
jgi:hypothetical protein